MIKYAECEGFDHEYRNQNGQFATMKNQVANLGKMNSFYNDAKRMAFGDNDGFILGGGMVN